ncbi:hypothetical protein [Sediminibacterium soli]|uniref:hypothetical protein n=1 Tax=Sediminibacterium soli TaxID=2698829 RepID=UPI00137B7830|nr:hypothetical protein [Sediminibacterium soli]NCI48056.1 hypothetical protein [Sediminibacterium soli]
MRTLKPYHIALSICLLFGVFASSSLKSQAVWENQTAEVYQFLYRMSQKGLLVFDDMVRPVSRTYIAGCLDTLAAKSGSLSSVEKKELAFYQREYTDRALSDSAANGRLFRTDPFNRWRMVDVNSNHFMLRIDPVFSAFTIGGTNKSVTRYSSGINLYGYGGKHWAFYFSYNDFTEKGTGIDTLRSFTPESGFVTKISGNKKSHNFSEIRAGISYQFKNGSISFNHDRFLWGYGENGRIVLSDKAPAYPYIRLDYQPLPWLSFNYMHAWLNSNILDSARTYPTGIGTPTFGARREFFIPKFMAVHSIRFTPVKGLDIALGESMVYSDRLDMGYLMPLNFYKVYDNLRNNNNINAGSNGQLFMQVSSRNHLPKTHLYASVFADEIRMSAIFDKQKSRNQIGYTVGASVTDIVVPYLTMGLEYTRINPFVYRNLLPAQDFTNSRFTLGDWMGSNADRFIWSVRYTPAARLKFLFRYQYIRKGGAGTLDQQYFQQPQPPFLFDLQNKQSWINTQVSYEWINRLVFIGTLDMRSIKQGTAGTSVKDNTFGLGLRYGL